MWVLSRRAPPQTIGRGNFRYSATSPDATGLREALRQATAKWLDVLKQIGSRHIRGQTRTDRIGGLHENALNRFVC
jgi:hypothetical protein